MSKQNDLLKERDARNRVRLAGPELLAALEWVVRNYEDAGVVGERAIVMAKAAIAKAKGETA